MWHNLCLLNMSILVCSLANGDVAKLTLADATYTRLHECIGDIYGSVDKEFKG